METKIVNINNVRLDTVTPLFCSFGYSSIILLTARFFLLSEMLLLEAQS